MFDIARQRGTVREQLRIADLMSLTPKGKRVLEIGARDCYLSRKLTALYPEVVALDLTKPEIDAPGITAVQGDVTGLRFANNAFDTVFCTEVLEHVPPEKLQQACNELAYALERNLRDGGIRGGVTFCDANDEPLTARGEWSRMLHVAGFVPVTQGMRLYC